MQIFIRFYYFQGGEELNNNTFIVHSSECDWNSECSSLWILVENSKNAYYIENKRRIQICVLTCFVKYFQRFDM